MIVMRVLGFKQPSLALILAFVALLPMGAEGQLRNVVSNEIAVSEGEATLHLGFQDQGNLTISFRDGLVLVDGETIGSYERRDGLDLAWRSLLGEAITLDDGPLALALNDWDPPGDLSGEAQILAESLDRTLEAALALPAVAEDAAAQEGVSVSVTTEEGIVAALLSRTGALSALGEALEGALLNEFTIKIGEDLVVEAGESFPGNLILVDGNLEVQGRIDGNVVLTGGTVRLAEGGVIAGDLRITDGSLERDGGSISGSLLQFDIEAPAVADLDESELADIRKQLEAEIRRDMRATIDRGRHRSSNPLLSLVGNVGTAIAGLLENLVTFLVLAILGVLAVHFQRDRLEVVATTARRAPVRSAVVGLAGGFFIVPIWIVGVIALAITIIGIPVLLAWVPLFPIVAGLAVLLGFLAVARNVGEWVAEQEYRGLEWIRGSNTFYTVVAGVGALVLPAVAASASEILGFGILTGLLGFVGSVVTFVAAAVGFGAVLLTRGGKIRPLDSYYDFEEDYWADVDPGETKSAASETAPEGEPGKAPSEDEQATEESETEEPTDAETAGGDGGDRAEEKGGEEVEWTWETDDEDEDDHA
jgi:hypothetical protein